MGHVFVSYSRRDKETVDQVVAALQKAGIGIWIDREDILAGNSWRMQIVEAIDTCDAFVLILSGNSAASVNVQKEVILAADSGRKLLVVMLETVKIPAEIRYQLAGLQFIDVPTIGLEKGVDQLTLALQEHLKKIKQAGEKTHSQMELVIQGVDISSFTADKQEQLLAFIANLTNADRNQLNIANMAAGSVHVFVDMPSSVAYQLKSMALNADARFGGMGIVSLRMDDNKLYVHVSQGALLPNATQSSTLPRNIFLFLALLLVIIAICFFSRPAPTIDVPASSQPEVVAATSTFTPTATTASQQEAPTATPTSTLTETPTATPTAIPANQILTASILNSDSACNYGPGGLYLNDESLQPGIDLEVFGRDIHSTWVYVQAEGYAEPCWVRVADITLNGDVESLEVVYPGKVTLPPSDFWPAPKNVYTARSKSNADKLSIYWDEFILADGDLEGPGAPRYLLELWLCQNGELTFTPIFAWENNIVVIDEAGCSEPSSGVIYLAEKHGYPGPVTIPWQAHP